MAFTVSCTACGSHFLLGDDLFRRKVSGNVVTVKCRNCQAEISVDARDADTLPSHAVPRKAPPPPRPKDKTVLVPPKPMTVDDATAIWDSEQTVSIAGKAALSAEPESIEFEEIPASSSDAPPLNTLTHEPPARVHPPRRNRAADDFLVNLSAGTAGIVGAPTIDVSALTSAPLAEIEAFEIEPLEIEPLEIEPELSTQRTGTVPLTAVAGRIGKGTIPLFDMSAVLPAASSSVKLGSESAAPMQMDIEVAPSLKGAAIPGKKARERKYVIAPQDAPTAHRAKRGRVVVWFGAAAVAAGVLAVVGLRGHRTLQPVAVPEPAAEHSAATLSNPAPALDSAPAVAPTSSAEAIASAVPSAAAATPAVKSAATVVKSVAAPPKQATEVVKPEAAAVATDKPTEAPTPATPAVVEARQPIAPAEPGTDFDRSAAIGALKSAAAQASSCRKDGDPSGTATLTITFAPSGRVTSATIQGPPFAGTPTGGCIASTMRHAQIPAFDGDRVTVTKTVVIE
jgi:hypothetical protein